MANGLYSYSKSSKFLSLGINFGVIKLNFNNATILFEMYKVSRKIVRKELLINQTFVCFDTILC